MYINLTKTLFLMAMMVGVMVSLSSNSWFMIWMGLELTLMSFLPLISSKSVISSESSMKYFIIQSMSSMVFMFSLNLMLMSLTTKSMMMISMLIKIAIPPFHSWITTMIEGLSYFNMFLIFTIMKIVPLMIMKKINFNMNLISMISLITGSILGLNQNSIKKILTYSSIFNMGFIISCYNSNSIMILYMLNYSMILLPMILILEKEKMMFINQMLFFSSNLKMKMELWVSMLSLGGLPPLTGFLMKIMIFEELIKEKETIMYFVMTSTSLITMYFYMNLSTNLMIFNTLNFKIKKNFKTMSSIILISSMLMFPIMTSIKI